MEPRHQHRVLKVISSSEESIDDHLIDQLAAAGQTCCNMAVVNPSGENEVTKEAAVMDIQMTPPNTTENSSHRERPQCSDRAELMEYIKRGQQPTWVPSPTLKQEYLRLNGESPPKHPERDPSNSVRSEPRSSDTKSLDVPRNPKTVSNFQKALHSGNFNARIPGRRIIDSPGFDGEEAPTKFDLDRQSSGLAPAPAFIKARPVRDHTDSIYPHATLRRATIARPRAPSLQSYSSSFIARVPTTPLVHESSAERDGSGRDRSASPDKWNRRYTLPGHGAKDWHHSTAYPELTSQQQGQLYRDDRAMDSRRCVTSTWSIQHPPSPPQASLLQARRPSISLDTSPRQSTTLVGSFEESILRGRMSTGPSQPFDFTAHVGVLGTGKRPNMPPHRAISFKAVYYDWNGSGSQQVQADEPSPYVGHIELQPDEKPALHHKSIGLSPLSYRMGNPAPLRNDEHTETSQHTSILGNGSYRIPVKGQIQVVIKNPYKTALKLFLVPYDLKGMRVGQKTFVRQRYYSNGPVLERAVTSAASPPRNSTQCQKPKLRYLIHLNICCPAKGHFYLYQSIRVVFANRVPDDKEYLSKDCQTPNPKYSVWKPPDDHHSTLASASSFSVSDAKRRKSFGHLAVERAGLDQSPIPGLLAKAESHRDTSSSQNDYDSDVPSPHNSHEKKVSTVHASTDEHLNGQNTQLPASLNVATQSPLFPAWTRKMSYQCPPGEHAPSDGRTGRDRDYVKLNQGDIGYGGRCSRSSTPEGTESLLAMRLRGHDSWK